MARRVCLGLLLIFCLASCSPEVSGTAPSRPTAQPGNPGGAFAALASAPLRLPRLAPGQACPLSRLSQVGPGIGKGLGNGPVHIFNGEGVQTDTAHSNKVAWGADPSYSGPLRIRGRRIDGNGQILFQGPDNLFRGAPVKTLQGSGLFTELDYLESHSTFPNVPSGWRMWPSGTYVSMPGCYAWQVDGLGFTEVITFRPFDVLPLKPGASCPVSRQQTASGLSADFGTGPAVGTGPIYALMGEMKVGTLAYHPTPPQGGVSLSKVLWIARPDLMGTVLIRGHQIDGPVNGQNWIQFGMDDAVDLALQWEIGLQTGWASLPSEIRLLAAGCYAFQVDGTTFSRVIVFEAAVVAG
jgi:hypothetical protein